MILDEEEVEPGAEDEEEEDEINDGTLALLSSELRDRRLRFRRRESRESAEVFAAVTNGSVAAENTTNEQTKEIITNNRTKGEGRA